MPRSYKTVRYPDSMRWLHWIMFVLVLMAYLCINTFELFPKGSAARINILASHFLFGIAVLLLVLPRFWLRKTNGAPPIHPPLDRWNDLLSKLTHYALYAFLLVQPLLGLTTLQIGGKAVTLFGVTLIPSLFGLSDRALSHRFEDVHVWIGEIFYWVIGLHILAALWHHYGRRDDTLKRML